MEFESKKAPTSSADAETGEALSDDSATHEALARLAENEWSWREAAEHWDACAAAAAQKPKILALAQKAYCLIELGQVDLAVEVFTSIADSVEGLKGLAEIAVLQGTMQDASGRWDECQARFPDHIAGLAGKAEILLQREMFKEADKLLSSGVQKWPDSAEIAVLWGRAATAEKNWEVAETRWKSVLAKWPSRRDVHKGYAKHLAALGDREAANLYLASLADQPIPLADCALHYHIANDDFPEAANQAARLAELEPHPLVHRLFLTSILMRDGAPSTLHAALSILKTLYRKSPESVSIAAQLAEVFIRLGLYSQAKDLIRNIPAGDRRYDVEILRAWLSHYDNNEKAAKTTWSGILDRRYIPAIHAPIENLVRLDSNEIKIGDEDILLFSSVRNEYARLDWFLTYYRKLGVNKFIIVDNASTDQSVNLLRQNQDVILYQTSDSFNAAGYGMRWINQLIEQHGQRNWCLCIDADESFVFPGVEGLGLRKLIDYLDWKGYEAMLAIMLDMYPAAIGKESQTSFETAQSSFKYFDNEYHIHGSPFSPYFEATGGVRRRLFEGYHLVNKVPLINGRAGIKFLISSHRTTPAKVANIVGGLLHYHLLYALQPQYRALFDEAIERREFPNNSLERLRCRELLGSLESDSLLSSKSVRYETSEQLLTLGTGQAVGLPRPDDYFLKFMHAALNTSRQ